MYTSTRFGCSILPGLMNLIFFYGTLMRGFDRHRRSKVDDQLAFVGHGSIAAALFDLGLYPGAVPATDGSVRGEVHEMRDPEAVLAALDEFEGTKMQEPATSLYTRERVPVTLDDGRVVEAWVYFYNAPIGRAPRIPSGDYLAHLGRIGRPPDDQLTLNPTASTAYARPARPKGTPK